MTTHRSLNKLEFKAHMNIHNVMEVADDECSEKWLSYTRDRFGKEQKVTVDGSDE